MSERVRAGVMVALRACGRSSARVRAWLCARASAALRERLLGCARAGAALRARLHFIPVAHACSEGPATARASS